MWISCVFVVLTRSNCQLARFLHVMKRSMASEAKAPKTQKLMNNFVTASKDEEKAKKPAKIDVSGFMQEIAARRLETADNILDFKFLKKRVRVLSKKTSDVKEDCESIVYWMSRDARVQDNWAFLFAQKLALKLELPLMVVCCHPPHFLHATLRHYKFLLQGLAKVENECRELDIPFHLLLGVAGKLLPEFVRARNVGAVICDFSPLREARACVEQVRSKLPGDVAFTEVDAHNLVPVWVTSDKQEYAARTIRNKLTSKLGEYLTEFPPLIKHTHAKAELLEDCKPVDWEAALAFQKTDEQVDEVDWARPGYEAACAQLHSFCGRRLRHYNDKRNDPTACMLSNMSPWFRFGHISVQRCILEVSRLKKEYKASVEAFCEEAVIRRELSDNFCFYNEHYDSLKGAASWAQQTLKDHSKDKRVSIYTLEEFEQARTHDDLWNSAQLQLVREAKMHGFLRMYWAKKILEWAATPDEALKYAIYLNDKYALDGNDPNGFVGCLWSIGGIHDQGWGERPVFGKIRYMNYQGCKRKFDVNAFVVRYGGKVYTKK